MVSSYKRVYVPKFCELCGREETDKMVWGRDVVRKLRVVPPHMGMVCDYCSPQQQVPVVFSAQEIQVLAGWATS